MFVYLCIILPVFALYSRYVSQSVVKHVAQKYTPSSYLLISV